jgi:hypothetical protein
MTPKIEGKGERVSKSYSLEFPRLSAALRTPLKYIEIREGLM